jgi:hypothetical protein
MKSPADAGALLRAALQRDRLWEVAFGGRNPRLLPEGSPRIVQMRAFDLEQWIEVAPGGIYEYWVSERGRAERQFRSADVGAAAMFLLQRGLGSQGKTSLRRSPFEPPPGFRISDLPHGGVELQWDDGAWAEFFGLGILQRALTFAWLTLEDRAAIAESVRSPAHEDPLWFSGFSPELRGPAVAPTVKSWKAWLREQEDRTDE